MSTITKLEINNFIGIAEATIKPLKRTVITGKNGQGKTSIIEAIKAALRGAGPDKIKLGASKAEIFISTEELEVRRRITAAGSTVTVKKNGETIPKPQAYLDGIIGDFSFEPVRFFLMSSKEQTEYLLKAIPVKATLEQLKRWTKGLLSALDGFLPLHGLEAISLAEKTLYDLRAADNARVKTLESTIREMESNIPAEAKAFNPADVLAVMEQISEAKAQANYVEEYAREIAACETLEQDLNADRDELRNKSEVRYNELAAAQAAAKIPLVDTEMLDKRLKAENKRMEELRAQAREIEQQISKAKIQNSQVQAAKEKADYIANDIKDMALSVKYIEEKLAKANVNRADLLKKMSNTNPIEIKPLQEQLEGLMKAQEYQRDIDRLADMRNELKGVKESAEARDKAVKTLQTVAPAEMLSEAKMPVDGLAYSAGQFTLHGVPIQNLSTSQKACLAVAVTRNLNKDYEIKAICLDNFESLDADTQKAFMEEAGKDGFQYFVSCVGNHDMNIKTE